MTYIIADMTWCSELAKLLMSHAGQENAECLAPLHPAETASFLWLSVVAKHFDSSCKYRSHRICFADDTTWIPSHRLTTLRFRNSTFFEWRLHPNTAVATFLPEHFLGIVPVYCLSSWILGFGAVFLILVGCCPSCHWPHCLDCHVGPVCHGTVRAQECTRLLAAMLRTPQAQSLKKVTGSRSRFGDWVTMTQEIPNVSKKNTIYIIYCYRWRMMEAW